ncbi:hypothetical protein ACWGB8_03195 [Kitasatospora sp. NPDC054939]
MEIEVDVRGGRLPDRLPGAPLRTPLAGSQIRLRVSSAHSDALLRRLPAGRPAARVLAVRSLEAGAEAAQTLTGAVDRVEPGEPR